MAFKERRTGIIPVSTLVSQVNIEDLTASTDTATFNVELALVVDGTTAANTAGTVGTYNEADNPLTTAAFILAAVEDAFTTLVPAYTSGITVVVDGSTPAAFDVTFGGDASGYNVDETFTGDANFATTATESVEGSSVYTKTIPVGRFAEVLRISALNNTFEDASVDLLVTDATYDASTVAVAGAILTKTVIDVSAGIDKFVATHIGMEASDGALTAVTPHLVEGPLTFKATASSPAITTAEAKVFIKAGEPSFGFRKRSSGTLVGDGANTQTSTFHLGAPVAVIKRIDFSSADASPDTSVAVTLVDADGKTLFSKTLDLTLEIDNQLAGDGVDEVYAALVNACQVIAKGPVVFSATSSLDTGKTVKCTVWCEV